MNKTIYLLCLAAGTALSVLAHVTHFASRTVPFESKFLRVAENRVTAIEREMERGTFTQRAWKRR